MAILSKGYDAVNGKWVLFCTNGEILYPELLISENENRFPDLPRSMQVI